MKSLIFILFIFLSFSAFSDEFPAKFSGDVQANGKQVIGAKVNVINKGDIILPTSVKDYGFIISLQLNANYTIEIIEKGFVKMTYSISTAVPDSDKKRSFAEFDMGIITLIEKLPNVDYSLFDKPVAEIKYNQELKKFEFDQKYKEQFENKLATLNEQIAKGNKPIIDKSDEQKVDADIVENNQTENKEIKDNTVENNNIVEPKEVPTTGRNKTLNENIALLDKLDEDDPVRANVLHDLAKQQYLKNDFDAAKENLEEALEIRQDNGDKQGESEVLEDLAAIEFDEGNFDKSIKNFDDAASLKLQLGDKEGAAYVYNDIALINSDLVRLDNALENFQLALELMKEEENKPAISNLLNSIGNIYYEKGDYNNALDYFNQSLELDQNLQNSENTAAALNNMGIAYHGMGDFDKAVESYEKSIDVNEDLGNKKGVSVALNNLGNINYDWNKYNKALEYYMKSLEIKDDLDYNKGLAFTLHNIGNVHKVMKQYENALEYYTKSADLAKKLSLVELLQRNYDALSKVYYVLNDCKNAYKYSIKLQKLGAYSGGGDKQLNEMMEREEDSRTVKSGLVSELKNEIERQKIIMQFKEQSQKLQIEIKNQEITEKDEDAKAQKQIIFWLIGGLLAFLILVILILRENRQKRKAKEKISILFIESVRNNEQIIEQQKEILDSINYAKRIQSAILPTPELFASLFPDNFLIFKPRDIVSGDFYWMGELENKKVLAVADCTGHGVPGAFMSMLGMAFLKEIVTKEYMTHPGIILNRLRKEVVKSLQQNEKDSSNKDGMDLVVCSIDKTSKMLQFAGANNSLIIIRDGKLIELKGDKMPVGIYEKMDRFSIKEYQLQTGDMLYMFSDGYADQFGGEKDKKFKIKYFKELLLEIYNKPVKEQQTLLNDSFEKWKGNTDQIDDIIVLCVKID